MPHKTALKIGKQLNRAQEFLSSSMNDGWWPYLFTRGKTPSIEATSWSAIALLRSHPDLARKAIIFLLNNQNNDGGWSTSPGVGQSDWNTALAVLALRVVKYYQPECVADKVLNKVLKNAFHYLITSRMDLMIPVLRVLLLLGANGNKSRLHFGKGWPWNKGGYSWVEPTAYCLMALKFPNLIDDQLTKIAVPHANQFLLDHACKGGGWNHGAFYCLGEYCPPYILTSAEAVLALIDIKENEDLKLALHYLKDVHYVTLSPWSLSWNILALHAYGYDCEDNLSSLLSLQGKDGSFGSNFLVTALSILALNTANGINFFKDIQQ